MRAERDSAVFLPNMARFFRRLYSRLRDIDKNIKSACAIFGDYYMNESDFL